MPSPFVPGCRTTLVLSALLAGGLAARADGPSRVDFNRDVRPLLAENCFACHGPDKAKRKGGLRLDVFDATHKEGAVLVPGKPDESELVQRLTSADKRKLMPPAASGKKLSPEQIALLRRWVAEGGRFEQHWAFVVPTRPTTPRVRDAAWPRNPIDHFILARLERERLRPSPQADRVSLLRRVTLDLTGLPPTPAEVDAFLTDTSPKAYEKVVDRLLKSPRYGEHMARYWLDLARYGDTHGLHLDNYREMWLYRDWVVQAFNANKPYDRFVTEQLAGDLLPGGSTDALVATGFNRAHVTTSEGGSIAEEVRVRNVNDRVETTGTVFLGLTVGCARCHDHKYDPISTKDFYALTAYFNSLDGNPLDGNAARHPPTLRVPTPQQAAAVAALERKADELRQLLTVKATGVEYDDRLDAAESERPARADFVWIDDAVPAGGNAHTDGRPARWAFVAAPAPVYSGALSLRHQVGGLGQHYFTGANPGLRVGAGDRLFAHVYLDPKDPPKSIMLQWHTDTWRHRAYWGENRIAFGRDNSPERRLLGPLPPAGKWVRLEVPIGQVGLKPGTAVTGWAFTQFGGTVYWDRAGIATQMPQTGAAFETLTAWVRAQRALKGAGLPPDVQKLVLIDRARRTPEQHARLRTYFVQHAWSKTREALAPLRNQLAVIDAQRARLDKEMPYTYVFREAAKARPAYVLKRGEYDQKGEPVGRATPRFLPASDARDRLGLARWLLAEHNPLPARVAVNRLWQQVFGQGIVRTAEDFGIQGEPPEHPELLDWLAVEFRQSGWDTRAMMRLLVTSAAYRQSARVSREHLAKDPTNRLLGRGPRFRLDAETLRDQALFAGGLLVERLGGPSVKPPQPPGIWSAVAYVGSNTGRFVADQGADKVFRRSLYTFWKRTAPPPQMTAFDAPSREFCAVRRERTNTPLQALVLLNDVQYVQAGGGLGRRALRQRGKGDAERIAYLFRLATCRQPDAGELAELTAMLRDLRAEYAKDTEAAKRLARLGATPADADQSPVELAAWTMLASTVLNLDEVLNK